MLQNSNKKQRFDKRLDHENRSMKMKKQNEMKEKQKFEHYFNDIFSNSNDTGDDNDNDDYGCNYYSKNKSTESD